MAMDKTRLPRNRTAPVADPAAPVAKPVASPAPVAVVPPVPAAPAPAAPAPLPAPTRVEGLDALTSELVQAAPLIPADSVAPLPAQPPDLAPAASGIRSGIKTPTVLVALGGAVAAGLLLIVGLRKPAGRGYSTAAGRTALAVAPRGPDLANIPTPQSWLKAGGA